MLSIQPSPSQVRSISRTAHTPTNLETTPAILTNGSDYASFWSILNKPFGFLQTGILPEEDPCYHQACDNIDNIDPELLLLNARAAAHQLTSLSLNGTKLIPKVPVEENHLAMIRERSLVPNWPNIRGLDEVRGMGEAHVGCGHEI